MTDEHIIQAARALGYQNDGLDILVGGCALLYVHEGALRVNTSDLDKAEEAVHAARAIQKRIRDTPPAPWVLGTNPILGTVVRHPSGMNHALDKQPAEWDDLIKLAEWAKTRNGGKNT